MSLLHRKYNNNNNNNNLLLLLLLLLLILFRPLPPPPNLKILNLNRLQYSEIYREFALTAAHSY